MALQTELYPVKVVLRDGTDITIRPLGREDKVRLLRFFEAVPEDERYYLKDDVASPEVIQQWTTSIDPERVFPMVAIDGDAIAADGTLHRTRSRARRHIGEIRLVVHPDYRGRGLGSRMIRELVDAAMSRGLHKVVFELVDRRQEDAIVAAKMMGFSEAARIAEGVKDYWGNFQDLVILELPLKEQNLWWRF